MIIIISITIVTHLDCLLRSSTLQGGGREPGNESAQPALGNDTSNTHARAQTRARDNWIERANFEVQRSSNRQDCWWLFFANHFLINWISDRKWRPVSETSHLNKEVFLADSFTVVSQSMSQLWFMLVYLFDIVHIRDEWRISVSS